MKGTTQTVTQLIAIVIFWSLARGVQAKLAFSKEFKHCNIITYDGANWIMLDFDRTGFVTRKINCPSGEALVKRLRLVSDISAIVAISVYEKAKPCWKPYLVRSCNEICRYACGIDIGLTLNPRHLYSKLLKYSGKRNYEVLSAWRRDHGISRRRQRAEPRRAVS